MSYIDELADRIRLEVPPAELPHDDTNALFRIYAVLLLSKGEAVNGEDVHNAWVAWMSARDGDHEALIPFEDLPADVAERDRPYVDAILRVATVLAGEAG